MTSRGIFQVHYKEDNCFQRHKMVNNTYYWILFLILQGLCQGNDECPPHSLYYEYINTCYWPQNVTRTFNEQRNKCEEEDGIIVQIPDPEVNEFLNNTIPWTKWFDKSVASPDIFIGVFSVPVTGPKIFYEIGERSLMQAIPSTFNINISTNNDVKDCTMIVNTSDSFEIHFKSCEDLNPAICSRDVNDVKECEPHELNIGFICFWMITSYESALKHILTCQEGNGTLAVVQNDTILTKLAAHGYINSWIGINDIDIEADFRETYFLAQQHFVQWNPGEPGTITGERCVERWYQQTTWNDLSCQQSRFTICQKIVSPTSSSTIQQSTDATFAETSESSTVNEQSTSIFLTTPVPSTENTPISSTNSLTIDSSTKNILSNVTFSTSESLTSYEPTTEQITTTTESSNATLSTTSEPSTSNEPTTEQITTTTTESSNAALSTTSEPSIASEPSEAASSKTPVTSTTTLSTTPDSSTTTLSTPFYSSTTTLSTSMKSFSTIEITSTSETTQGYTSNSSGNCRCPCTGVTNSTMSDAELETKKAEIRKKLLLPKSTISAFRRSKSSTYEDRPTAKGLGLLGVLVIGGVISFFIILDVTACFR